MKNIVNRIIHLRGGEKMNRKPILLTVSCIAAVLTMMLVFSGFASLERFSKTIDSDLNGGLDRTVVIYTYTGEELARYEGKIDLETTDGGKLLFDLDGKRYIYYNCTVEVIEK